MSLAASFLDSADGPSQPEPSAVPRALRRRWWGSVLVAGSAVIALGGALGWTWAPAYALRWAGAATVVLLFVLGYLRHRLPENHRPGGGALLASLGVGTRLTLARGVGAALLAGFLVVPRPPDLGAWLPSLLYLSIAVADFFDGYLARVRDHVTRLGGTLDVAYDALGTLVAIGVGVQHGVLPSWYVGVGLLYYAFHAHMAVRRWRGHRVWALPENPYRRQHAGFLFGYLVVVLTPLFEPPATVLAGILFALPVVLGFARDWCVAAGASFLASPAYRRREAVVLRVVQVWVPVGVRLGLAVAGMAWLSLSWAGGVGWGVLALAGFLMAAAGWLGRLGALLLIGAVCVDLVLQGATPYNMVVLAGSIVLLLLGTGRLSRWRPEDALLLRRAGRAPTSSASDSALV